MDTYYKLTDADGETRDGFRWEPGRTYRAKGEHWVCCTDGVLHAYKSPELAAFLTPLHNDFVRGARLFEVEGRACNEQWDKVGCRQLKCIRELEAVKPASEQHTAFGILCAMQVFRNEVWLEWAKDWLSATARSIDYAAARYAADRAAAYAARTAAYADANAAAYADRAAAYAARTAAYAAAAAYTAADVAAAYAAHAAAAAAHAATFAPIDFVAIAKKAMEY